MSGSKKSGNDGGGNETGKRNLPSWMSSRENEESNQGENPKQAKGRGKEHTGSTNLSKLMEGVVFVLSGFVNPERGILRSQALEMGAEYRPDWNSDCTLLVCAFPNTPKFRQVESDCGTIVSKEWISECFAQKKLVDIESFLMHVGKPWRRRDNPIESQDQKAPHRKPEKKAERGQHSKPIAPVSSEHHLASNTANGCFSPSEVKRWAVNDLNRTIRWLESQDEKPDPSEIRKIAAEGILTCLQDVIDSLEQKQDIQHVTEQWNFIPRAVEELTRLENTGNALAPISNEERCRQAKACKQLYEEELSNLADNSSTMKKRPNTDERNRRMKGKSKDAAEYDSDETIEMTEEEIELAYKTVSAKICQ